MRFEATVGSARTYFFELMSEGQPIADASSFEVELVLYDSADELVEEPPTVEWSPVDGKPSRVSMQLGALPVGTYKGRFKLTDGENDPQYIPEDNQDINNADIFIIRPVSARRANAV